MLYDPRTLAYVAEVYFPPTQLDVLRVQQVHHELFNDSVAGYRNFNLVPGGATLSNPHVNPAANSSCAVLGDRVRITEELTFVTLDDFLHRQTAVVTKLAQRLEIPIVIACQVSIRTLVNARHYKDAREFFARGLFRFTEDDLAALSRPSHTLGLRMVFPQSEENRSFYQLRIESYAGDPRSIFLENVGMFPGILQRDEFHRLGDCVRETYQFLTEPALEFLSRFDQRSSLDGLDR